MLGQVNAQKLRGKPNLAARKVARPPYEQLLAEIEATSFLAVGRKYGVSATPYGSGCAGTRIKREREAAGSASSAAEDAGPDEEPDARAA